MGNSNDVKLSPFRYEKGMRVSISNTNDRVTSSFILKGLSKGFMVEDVRIMMELVGEFGVINRYNATKIYAMRYGVEKDFKELFTNMVKWGILIRYNLTLKDGHELPHVYSLSVGASAFINVRSRNGLRIADFVPPKELINQPAYMLERVALTQFLISFYGDEIYKRCIRSYYNYKVIINSAEKVGVDSIFRIDLGNGKTRDLVVVPIRLDSDYRERFSKKLKAVLKCSVIVKPVTVLVICESDVSASKLEMLRASIAEAAGVDVFFVSDTVLVNSAPLSKVYSLSPSGDEMRYNVFDLEKTFFNK